jgi:hypothetical protein
MVRFVLCLALVLCSSQAFGIGFRITHQGLVNQSGIRPAAVRHAAEGVGMSTRSEADAIRNCCFWGQRQPVSIQTNYLDGRYYAVVRYR